MAADDERGPAPDPWDEIVAEGLDGESGDAAFSFAGDGDAAPPPAAGGPEAGDAAAPTSDPVDAAEAGDALAADWLSDDTGDAVGTPAAPQLAVFAPDEAAGGSSAIDIGTGASGIALHGEPEQEEIGGDAFAAALPGGHEASAEEPSGADGGGFPGLAAGTGGAVQGTPQPKRSVKRPVKRSGSGIGQLIGVVGGGLSAIPITMAILLYGLGKDPFGVAKYVPAEVAFLLPEKFRPGYKKPAVPVGGPRSALDDLPVARVPVRPEPESSGDASTSSGSAVADAGSGQAVDQPATPDLAVVEPPARRDPDRGRAPPAPPQSSPLDTTALDAAVVEARSLGDELGAADDRNTKAYKSLRKRWYRALARVAEELVAVEHAAATTGRPLAGAPENVVALHGGLSREAVAAELATLAPNWLAYPQRESNGIVLPATFESARRVGPYWTSRVSIRGTDGEGRDLTIISRLEPAAITGDRVVVTGMVLDGAVIWAADVRGVPVQSAEF